MTTAGLDGPLTAADLLFGSSADAPEALTRHLLSDGRSLGRALARLPRVTREAAVREAAVAAAGLLKVDLIEVLVSGWREHRDIYSAARRTLAMPGSKELVGLAPHRVSTIQQPAVSILIDGHRVHTLQLGLSIIFDVTGLVAGVSLGRLAAVHSGRCEAGVALTVHEIEVLTKRAHLELRGVLALKRGFRLLPGSEYPADAPVSHPGAEVPASHVPGGHVPGGEHHGLAAQATQFPGVDLLDSQSPPAAHVAAGHQDASHPSSEHPGSAEAEHRSALWWEKSQPDPTRIEPTRPPRAPSVPRL